MGPKTTGGDISHNNDGQLQRIDQRLLPARAWVTASGMGIETGIPGLSERWRYAPDQSGPNNLTNVDVSYGPLCHPYKVPSSFVHPAAAADVFIIKSSVWGCSLIWTIVLFWVSVPFTGGFLLNDNRG